MRRPSSLPSAPSLLAAALLLIAGIDLGAQAPLTVTGAWVREPVPGRPATAAYAVLENTSATEVQIVSATADIAGTVELHEMVRAGDMMKMSPVKSIAVPAKGKVELKPGGLHVMLFELKKPVKDGDTVTLTFKTSSGATVQTTAAVRKGQMMR
jgi:periplasmic copper chaperone A